MRRLTRVVLTVGVAVGLVLYPTPAGASHPIQPGASIMNSTGGQCTLNWVYDGTGARAGEVFVGTAGHCVNDLGEPIALTTGTFGSAEQVIGEVAYISQRLDAALIRVDPGNHGQVLASMKGHPGFPTGVSTTSTASVGDIVQYSGHGVGFHLTTLTQESRVGVLHSNDGDHHSALGTVTFGDSGGPVGNASDGNRALGLVTVICVGIPCMGQGGVSLQGMLADAAANGFPVELRTV